MWLLLVFFFSLTTILAAFQFPFFQTKLVAYISDELSEKLEHKITINYVIIDWFDQLSLEGLQVIDQSNRSIVDAGRVWVDFDIKNLLFEDFILIDEVQIDELKLELYRAETASEYNFDVLIRNIRELTAPKDTTKSTEPKPLLITKASIKESAFGIYNMAGYEIDDGYFDYHRFKLNKINAELDSFYILRDSVFMNISSLSTIDSLTNLDIKQLNTRFSLTAESMNFDSLYAEVGSSIIQEELHFSFDDYSAFQDFNHRVNINASLKDAIIHNGDLQLFAPQLSPYNEIVKLGGLFKGTIASFQYQNAEINFGKESYIFGKVAMDGLPNFEETFINLNLTRSNLLPEDLFQYIQDSVSINFIKDIGQVAFMGQFIGFSNDFVANGTFNSRLGRIESDINLKLDGTEGTQYSGNISVFNFELGQLLNNDSLYQKLQFSGQIKGQGLNLDALDTDIDVKVDFIGLNGYNYQNISSKSHIAKSFFQGNLTIDDPHIQLKTDASIDLRKNRNLVKIKAQLDTLVLHAINLIDEEAILKFNVDADFSGLELDQFLGKIYINDFYGQYQQKPIQLDTINVLSTRSATKNRIQVDTELMDASIEGDFRLSRLISDVQKLAKEFMLNIDNKADKIQKYYSNTKLNNADTTFYTAQYAIELKNVQAALALFLPQLQLSQNEQISGRFSGGKETSFKLQTTLDTLIYDQLLFVGDKIDLTINKSSDSSRMFAQAHIKSNLQKFGRFSETDSLQLDARWENKEVDFSAYISQNSGQYYIDLAGALQFLDVGVDAKIERADLKMLDKNWTFLNQNKVSINNYDFEFNSFGIQFENQKIEINGFISEQADKKASITIDNVDVANFNSLIDKNYYGQIDGIVEFQDLYRQVILEGDFAINDFKINEFLVGNILGKSVWDNQSEQLNLNFSINRLEKEIIKVLGGIRPRQGEDELELSATFNEANINIAEPFVNDIFSKLDGTLSGDFTISGRLDYPILRGKATINNGEMRINYLNTSYLINGPVEFNQDAINFMNVQLTDANNNEALLSGDITHKGFSALLFNLKINANTFRVLNTSIKENPYFYGTGNVSGEAFILGDPDNLSINANVRTDRNTRISIPVVSNNTIEQQEYINFIDLSDTSRQITIKDEIDEVDIKGLTLNLDIEITPEAYAEIIFDQRAGDIIRGRGNGKISLQIDSNGEFLMFGDYEFTEGGYNFTLYDVINKEFNIDQGSKISWFGDPYEGQLDINAIYEQNVSILPLLISADSTVANNSLARRRYPTKVKLKLTENLLSPEIDFNIEINGYPEQIGSYSVGGEIQAFKTEIAADEQELNKQVFSLILLRRFQARQSFIDVTGQAASVGNSVSELLSNQLSNWLSQVDENFEIELDIGSLDQDALNTFQMRMSYTFLDGRLRVSRDGNMANQAAEQSTESEVMGIIGDWTVEYLLSRDGKLRVRMYNRTNINPYAMGGGGSLNATNQTTTSAGASLIHVQSFNSIRDIFNFKKDKKDKNIRREDEPEIENENQGG